MGHKPSRKLSFCLVSLENIFPKVLGFVKMFFLENVRQTFVFVVTCGFSLWHSSMDDIFAWSLCYCLIHED